VDIVHIIILSRKKWPVLLTGGPDPGNHAADVARYWVYPDKWGCLFDRVHPQTPNDH